MRPAQIHVRQDRRGVCEETSAALFRHQLRALWAFPASRERC